MLTTLLFSESPIIGFGALVLPIVFYRKDSANYIAKISLLVLIFFMVFYRYEEYTDRYDDNVIISPAEGTITSIKEFNQQIHISIYLGILNKHTQIYPVNGTVIERYYDTNGKFALATDMEKSRDNEKKIHVIQTPNGEFVTVTQIAGFFPRRIASSDKVPENVKAGEYLGIIKFGSRVDLLFSGDITQLKVKLHDTINLGDIIYNPQEDLIKLG